MVITGCNLFIFNLLFNYSFSEFDNWYAESFLSAGDDPQSSINAMLGKASTIVCMSYV